MDAHLRCDKPHAPAAQLVRVGRKQLIQPAPHQAAPDAGQPAGAGEDLILHADAVGGLQMAVGAQEVSAAAPAAAAPE